MRFEASLRIYGGIYRTGRPGSREKEIKVESVESACAKVTDTSRIGRVLVTYRQRIARPRTGCVLTAYRPHQEHVKDPSD